MKLRKLWLVVCVAKESNGLSGALPWGKKACKIWRKEVDGRSQTQKMQVGQTFSCHPLAQLRWTDWSLPDGVVPPWGLGTWHFDVLNSAGVCFAVRDLDVWNRAFQLAKCHEDDDVVLTTRVVRGQAGPPLVASPCDLIPVAASALLDRDVECQVVDESPGVEIDRTKLWIGGTKKRQTHIRIHPPENAMIDPRACQNSRIFEAPVWPKVYHFAKLLDSGAFDHPDAFQARFGAVTTHPWDLSRFTIGSRHRATAALLARKKFKGTSSAFLL